jgi:hypothetical protein
MNMPGFDSESSLGPTVGIYRGKAVRGKSGAGEGLLMQDFLASSTLSRNLLFPQVGGMRGRHVSGLLPPKGCIDIHYVPECYSPNPLTECCTNRHEVRCTECHSTVSPPINGILTV